MPWFRRDKPDHEKESDLEGEFQSLGHPSLSGEILEDVEAKRSWTRGFVHDHSLADFDTSWQFKVDTLAAIIEQAGLTPDQTVQLQALGITLGDAIAQRTGAVWVQVTDEYGTDPALALGGPNDVVVFPTTMISKRLERGETVDSQTLYGLVEHAAQAATRDFGSPS